MKLLKDIIPSDVIEAIGNLNVEITGICFDSRKVQSGNLFVALSGHSIDGSTFVADAVSHGAVAALVEGNINNSSIPVIKVKNARAALSVSLLPLWKNSILLFWQSRCPIPVRWVRTP